MSNLTYCQYPRSVLYAGTWRQLRRNRSRNEMPWDQPKSIQGDIEKHGLISAQLQLRWSHRRPRSSRLASLCTPRWPRPVSTLHAPMRSRVWGRMCVGALQQPQSFDLGPRILAAGAGEDWAALSGRPRKADAGQHEGVLHQGQYATVIQQTAPARNRDASTRFHSAPTAATATQCRTCRWKCMCARMRLRAIIAARWGRNFRWCRAELAV